MSRKIVIFTSILVICLLFSGMVMAAGTQATSTKNVSSADKPSIVSITPNSGKAGEKTDFVLTGKNFSDGIKVFIEKQNGQTMDVIYADSVKVQSPTTLSGTFAIVSAAPTGAWDLGLELDGMKGTSKITYNVN